MGLPHWIGFVLRRLATSIVLLLLLSFVTFFAFSRIPSEPAAFVIDVRYATPEQVQHARHVLGADRSIFVQYKRFVWRALHGDLGRTWSGQYGGFGAQTANGYPVLHEVWKAAGVTGAIALGGFVLLLLVSVPLGLLAASRPRSLLDRAAVAIGIVGVSTHPLVVGLVLQLFLGSRWHVVPPSGYCSFVPHDQQSAAAFGPPPCGGPAQWALHLALPWATFALFFIALYSRMIRARMLEVLDEPYIRTARAKGVPQWRVLLRHAMPNSVLPLVTMVAMDLGTAVGISTYVEAVYRLPGLGYGTLRALTGAALDLPLLMGIVMFTGTAIIVLNFVVDMIAVALDPTISRSSRVRTRPFGLASRVG